MGWLRIVQGGAGPGPRVLAAEEPELRVYRFDPGDMRTAMHQAAFPGEDISDRPEPGIGGAAVRRLLDSDAPSGRYRAGELGRGHDRVASPPERFTYDLPSDLEASEPPEARGLTRDAVRMLVTYRSDRSVVPSSFTFLTRFLQPGDLVVINTSGTIPAAVDAVDADGYRLWSSICPRNWTTADGWWSRAEWSAGRPSGGRDRHPTGTWSSTPGRPSPSRSPMAMPAACGWPASTWGGGC